MSGAERRSTVSLITTLLVSAPYMIYVFQNYPLLNVESSDSLRLWASAILLVIPLRIVAEIVTQIALSIFTSIITRKDDKMLADERDKTIELKAMRNSLYGFMIGFIGALGALALGHSLAVMFQILIGSLILVEVIQHLSQSYYYRRGL